MLPGMTTRPTPPADRLTVEAGPDQLARLAALPADEPVTMLNLMRFRETADYSHAPDLAPAETISGSHAYARYGKEAQAHMHRAGVEVLHHGPCGPTVIGPDGEDWDAVLLVRYPSPAAFVAMVTSPEYQALSRHRTAALADARLIPTTIP